MPRRFAIRAALWILLAAPALAGEPAVRIETPQSPPTWALLERELIAANTQACQDFFARYFDERGYLLCVERWGGNDGPDDAIENCNDWPLLHAIGAPDVIRELYTKAWEGHLRQYTEARTTDVPFARDGMYYKEFPVMMDWVHNGEGVGVFNLQGLSAPDDARFRDRVRRFAGFYLNEDPGAPNYDPERRIIRSLFNGSRGPLLRPATALDWAGDPIEVENRFKPGHGERNYAEMLEHFRDYNDIVGDHPLNLLATSLATNAYLLEREEKYRRWVLEYVNAWSERMAANGGIIPSNIGLDGKIGSTAQDRWYGGVYGWGFSVDVPQTGEIAHRNVVHRGFHGFANAFFLTGDYKYLAPWAKQLDLINEQGQKTDGRMQYPRMYGSQGWYDFHPEKLSENVLAIWYLGMRGEDRARVPANPWLDWLETGRGDFPEAALRADLDQVRRRTRAMRSDRSTPDTRLADDSLQYNPASVVSLVQLALGGLYIPKVGSILHCRVRYFDPESRRAGLPDGVAALVERLTEKETTVALVNVDQTQPARVIVQAGAYGEHRWTSVTYNGKMQPLDGPSVTIELAPGAGGKITLETKRYASPPDLAMPWNR